MPIASPSTAAASSLHAHQRSTHASSHGSHHANTDKSPNSPFSMLVDAASAPEQPPRPEAPARDSGPRDAGRGRDQAPSNNGDPQAAETAPAAKAADQASANPTETSEAGDQPVVAADGTTSDTTSTEDPDALLAGTADQASVVDPSLSEADAAATMAAAAAATPVPPTPPTPPAVAIAIPVLAPDAPAPAPADTAGIEKIAAASEAAPAAATAAPSGTPMPVKPELSPFAGNEGEKTDKAGDKTIDAKGSAQATSDQPVSPNSSKPADTAATPTAKAAPSAADGDKTADIAQPVGHEKPAHHAAEAADGARAADRPTTTTASDNRLSSLHLVSGATGHEALQASGANTPVTSAAAASQIVNRDAVGAAVPLASVAVEISARAQAGSNRFEIRLDPPELGRIEVRLDVDRHGNVTSRLIADRGDTLDLLRREAPQLERALQDAGLKTSDNGLQFSLRDQGTGAERNSRETPAPAALQAEPPEVEPLPAEALRSYRWSGATGGVDIRV